MVFQVREHDCVIYDAMDERSVIGSVGQGPDGVWWLLRSAKLGGGIAFGVTFGDVIEQSLVLERVQALVEKRGPLWWLE